MDSPHADLSNTVSIFFTKTLNLTFSYQLELATQNQGPKSYIHTNWFTRPQQTYAGMTNNPCKCPNKGINIFFSWVDSSVLNSSPVITVFLRVE